MLLRDHVEAVLERIRPYLQADGGDVELVEVIGTDAVVRLTGVCAGCPSAHMTLHYGVEAILREEIPEFGSLELAARAE